jgi:hypothetical protein
MKTRFSIAAVVGVALGAAGAVAAELPTFELLGFPITPVQVQVVGSAHVQEQSPTPTLMLAGMPASPHQVGVLTPRRSTAEQASKSDQASLAGAADRKP